MGKSMARPLVNLEMECDHMTWPLVNQMWITYLNTF